MNEPIAKSREDGASLIAVTVMDFGAGPAPCPFFGKCDGILVIDSVTGTRELHRNPPRTPTSLCDLVLACNVHGLVCGFITEPELDRLRAAGIDVRNGSCNCRAEELAANFHDLPQCDKRPRRAEV